MLENLFTSKTRIKLLKLFLFNHEEHYLREISRIINITPIYVSKELNKLEKINLIKKTKKGNLNLYKINKNNIFLEDLKRIFIKTDYLGEYLKKELKNKVTYAFIFGSFAKNTEKESSDIDLFIISETKEDSLIKFLQKLEKTINREINYVLWNQKTFKKRASEGHHLLRTIRKEKIMMILGNEGEFKKEIK